MAFVDFEPEQSDGYDNEIPYLEDVNRMTSWEGHTTPEDEDVIDADNVEES